MCELCTEAEGLILLSEAEHLLILAEADTGANTPDAWRHLSPVERRLKVRFGDIQAAQDRAVKDATGIVNTLWSGVAAAVGRYLPHTTSPAAVSRAVTDLTLTPPVEATRVIDAATQRLTTVYGNAMHDAADLVTAEAHRQGAAVTRPVLDTAGLPEAIAARVALTPWTRTLNLLGQTPDLTSSTGTAMVLEASRDGSVDTARQGVHQAHTTARNQTALDLGAQSGWASELLDRRTCGPCSRVDGHDYTSIDDALADYPGFGGYTGCNGGPRCRGMLVWEFEG